MLASPVVMRLHLFLWNMQCVFLSSECLRPLCLHLCLAPTLCPAACVRWLSLYILSEVSLAQLSLSCIIPLVTSSLLYPSAQGLRGVCVCVCVHACVCAYVKACNCNPHPATSDQVFSLSHQQYAAEKAEAACVQVSLMVVSKFEKRWTVLLKGVTVWISKYWVKSWVNWIEAHSVGLNALWDFT